MKRAVLLILMTLLFAPPSANATYLGTLSHNNSTYDVHTGAVSGGAQWEVAGVAQLFEQGFFFRIGATGDEIDLGSIYTPGSYAPSGSNGAVVSYAGFGLEVDVHYLLVGGVVGSQNSDLAEVIHIRNTSGSAMDLHFFQYADFDLGNTPNNDEVWFTGANTVAQRDLGGWALSETVVTSNPNHREADGNYALWYKFFQAGQGPTTLNDQPPIGTHVQGDTRWAFQWDRTLAAGGDFIISKDKNLRTIPEPGTLFILGIVLAGFGLGRRARRRQA